MPDYTNDIYDVEKAFRAIEDELTASMMRNMQRHRDWEDFEGFRWSQWQAEQLKALEKYKKDNRSKFQRQFSDINSKIDAIITSARQQGGMDQELGILKAIKAGHLSKRAGQSLNTTGEFFRLNTRKLDALITATHDDFAKAEFAVLRQADDQYRKIIFNAQMYANSGAGTYAKAVDMATKDFLSAGIKCVEYRNGTKHSLSEYSTMCLRTASKRAYLTGEGEKRQEWGEHLVIMNKRGNPCPKCLPFVGKILIDDVWSGGSHKDGDYPLMSSAIEAGLYHPNCRDGHTTYFPEISDIEEKYSSKEIQQVTANYMKEQRKNYIENMIERYKRLATNSLDPENKAKYADKVEYLKNRLNPVRSEKVMKKVPERKSETFTFGAEERRTGDLKKLYEESKKNALVNNSQSDIIRSKNNILQDSIDNGTVKFEINKNKQGRHIKESKDYIEGRSYVYGNIEDMQKLVDDLHGTGELVYKPSGEWNKREKVIADRIIGVDVDCVTGKESKTSKATIHYSKTGSHVVPRKE